jgi:hypothetical protein
LETEKETRANIFLSKCKACVSKICFYSEKEKKMIGIKEKIQVKQLADI